MFTSTPSINPNEDGFQRKPLFADGPAVKALPIPTARALAPTKISRCAMLEALALTDTTAKITPAQNDLSYDVQQQLSSATSEKIELHRIHPTAVISSLMIYFATFLNVEVRQMDTGEVVRFSKGRKI